MSTVYQIQILNHLVDGYEQAERKTVGAERWLKSCSRDVAGIWDEIEETEKQLLDPQVSEAANFRKTHLQRRLLEKTNLRHQAESDLSIAREREQQAMRTLCDAVLLAARGSS